MPFVKVDIGILDSSLWSEPAQTCKCWFTLLAMADSEGVVRSTAPGIARRANLGQADTEKALALFESPDDHSRSTNDEGRRIKRIDGGYLIINYGKYREKDHTAAARMRKWRALRNGSHKAVTLRKQKQSTDTDKEEEKKDSLPIKSRCSQKEAEEFCISLGLPASDGTAMFLHWEEKGWGKVKDWKLTIRKWKSFGYLPSQKQRNGQQKPVRVDYKRNYIQPPNEPTEQQRENARLIAKREVEKLRTELNMPNDWKGGKECEKENANSKEID